MHRAPNVKTLWSKGVRSLEEAVHKIFEAEKLPGELDINLIPSDLDKVSHGDEEIDNELVQMALPKDVAGMLEVNMLCKDNDDVNNVVNKDTDNETEDQEMELITSWLPTLEQMPKKLRERVYKFYKRYKGNG